MSNNAMRYSGFGDRGVSQTKKKGKRGDRGGNNRIEKVLGDSVSCPKEKWDNHKQFSQGVQVQGRTKNQKHFLQLMQSKEIIVCDSPAGVGKTYLMCAHAANKLLKGEITHIILCRPYASCGGTMGYNSGSLNEKIMPFMLPMIGYLKDFLGANHVQYLMDIGKIEIVPFEVIRGRNFENSVILADEIQSADISSIQAVTTRMSSNCQLIMTGDKYQNDIKRGEDGMTYIKRILRTHKFSSAGICEMTMDDCQRNGTVREFLEAYNAEGWV